MSAPRPPRAVRIFVIAARLLLPRSFRREYGQPMIDAFHDLCRDSRRRPAAGRLIREFAWLVVTAVRARASSDRPYSAHAVAGRTNRPGAMRALPHDIRHAARGLAREPAFAAFAVITLALGIGTNTAIFSVIEAVLLEPLPYPQPDRLVGVFETSGQLRRGVTSAPSFREWSEHEDIFEAIAAIQGASFHLSGDRPEQLWGRAVSPQLFRVMGVSPILGRPLTVEDERASPVVVVGHGLWQRRFGGDSALIDRDIILNGDPHTVVGIMPPGFEYPNDTEIWTPLELSPEMSERRGWYFLSVIARLRPDVSLEQAQARMDATAAERAERFPEFHRDRGINVERLHDVQVGSVRRHLWMLFGAVGLVLIIACTNVANLLLSRAVSRQRDISIRAALGAGRGRLLRQLLTESLVLGVAGGVAGTALAAGGVRVFGALAPSWFPRFDRIDIDATVLAYTLGITLVTSVLFGLAPAWRLTRSDIASMLRPHHHRSRRSRFALGQGLVVVQTALALLLLTGATLLVRSFHHLTNQPIGFDATGLLSAHVGLPRHVYPDPNDQAVFFRRLMLRLEALPGARVVAASDNLPFTDMWYGQALTVQLADGTEREGSAARQRVSPGLIETLGLPIVRGRTILETDIAGAEGVALVDQAFVDTYLPDADPLGARLRSRRADRGEQTFAIIGVVGDAKHLGLDDDPEPTVYYPIAQRPAAEMFLVVRTNGPPLAFANQLTHAVHDAGSEVPVTRVRTMEQLIASSLDQPRFYTVLLGVFAGTAVVLACVGVYGLLSYLVAQQAREIGIRMALGARGGRVRAAVVGRAIMLAAPGITIGLAGALVLNGILEGLLFQITPNDPLTFALATGLFLALTALAAFLPARRSTQVDPVQALRAD